jgi:hypothetical protein
MSKYRDQIQKRINEYNEDFSASLLNGLKLISLSCQTFRGREDWYTSVINDQLETNLFDFLEKEYKEKEGSTTKETFIAQYHHKNKDIEFKCDLLKVNDLKTALLEFCERKFDCDTLLTFKNADINEDNQIDMSVLTTFQVEENFTLDKSVISRFIKYPEDFFTSPVIADYLDMNNSKEALKAEHQNLRNRIANYGHIAYRTVAGNMTEYQKIQDAADTEPISTIRKNIDNIIKRINYVDITLKITAKENDSDIDDFQKIKTLGEMIDFVNDNFVAAICHKVNLNFENPAYKDISFDKGYRAFFVLYWNLLHNADKHTAFANKTVDISIFEKENNITICFKNYAGVYNVNAAIRSYDDLENSDQNRGLGAIHKSCKELGWTITIPKIGNITDYTYFEIIINTTLKAI